MTNETSLYFQVILLLALSSSLLKGGFHLNTIFPPCLNGNISFTFQAIQKLYNHTVNLCCGMFCEFLGDFWVYFRGEIVFLEGLVKLREIRNIEDLVKF